MEVPIEQMPEPAKSRITSLMRTMGARCTVDGRVAAATVLGKFYADLIPDYMEKQVGDGTIEDWVFDWLKRDDGWVEEMARDLLVEAEATRAEAVRAQLCSAIGKDLPELYELSADEEEEARLRARESAQSVADTYNEKLRGWIEEVKAEWWEDHGGSFIGLNRFNLLKLTQAKVEDYDAWKIEEIAATEFSYEWQQQALSFWIVNRGTAELEYFLAPRSASDPRRDSEPICASYAGRWLSEDDAQMFPAHVNCIHFVERTRVKDGRLPLYFLIGGVRYNTEELPDC